MPRQRVRYTSLERPLRNAPAVTPANTTASFSARLQRPELCGNDGVWAFVLVPKDASAKLPRRGRVTVDASINGLTFRILLEPDGQKGHWLRVDQSLLEASGTTFGQVARFEIGALAQEPEPSVPPELAKALESSTKARATWETTTPIARLDWIHWITSAKQAATQQKRIRDACDKLASGKKRVCCFDPSDFYSKAFIAPRAIAGDD